LKPAAEIIVVKIGGRAADREDRLRELCAEMAALGSGVRFLLVHGGGSEVTRISGAMGFRSIFKDGLRQTSPEEMDVVDMVLSGKVNKGLVRLCRLCGLPAVGVSGADGGMITGRPVDGAGDGNSRTAEVDSVDCRLLELLLSGGYLPVVSPASTDREGRGMNVNADGAAFALSAGLSASSLVFLSDVPGIMEGDRILAELTAAEAKELAGRGVVSGGMVPKVAASVEALSHGVQNVIIGEYGQAGALRGLLSRKIGTRIRG
jgi:acetylglutamate kinase